MITFVLVKDNSYVAVLGIFSALLHELGHLLAMQIKGSFVREIDFGLVNIDILDDTFKGESSDKNQLFVLLSGAAFNFIVATFMLLIYFLSRVNIFKIFGIQNFIVGTLNLFPISQLDGGRILFILISKKLDIVLADKILKIISIVFLLPIIVLGFIILVKSRYNFSLLILGCYLLSYILFRDKSYI